MKKLVFCLFVMTGCGSITSYKPAEVIDPESWVNADIKIMAYKLAKDYSSNPVRGDSIYKGKLIAVIEDVNEIGKAAKGQDAYILLSPNVWGEKGVKCFFNPEHVGELSSLPPKSRVLIVGRCDGCERNTILINCRVARFVDRTAPTPDWEKNEQWQK